MGTYFVVVILMCLVFFIGTILVTRTVEENARQVNEDNAVFMQNSLDDVWQRVYQYSIQIINHSTAKRLENAETPEEFTDKTSYELSAEFKKYIASNQMVEDLYLYYPDGDYVVGNLGVYSAHTYWAALYGVSREYSDSTWKHKLFGNREMGYFTVQNGTKLDLYYRMSAFDITGRILVAKINTAEIEETLGWIRNDNENGFLAMVDNTGSIFAWAGNYEVFADPETNQILPVDEKEYLSTQLDSNITSLRYVTITERSQAYYQSNSVMYLALVFLLIAFISGGGISVMLARRNSLPVQQLARKLRGEENIQGNELQYINQQIDDLLLENKNALDALTKQQNRMIGRTFLNECLKFTQKENIEVEAIAAICGITFENALYTLVVRERSASDYASNISAALDETEDDENVILWTQKQDLDVLLVNYDEPIVVEHVLEALKKYSSEYSRIVCGEATKNPEQIRTMYLDCLRQLQRREVVLLPNTAEPKKEFDALKGKTILGSFQKYLADEDYRNAKQLVPELCSKYLNADRELERTCYRYVVIQNLLHTKSAQDMRQSLVKLAQETDITQFEQHLCDLLEQCARLKRIHQDNDNDIASSARCIIDDLYADPLLSLHMISEEIGISQSYVSRMFKKKYGIGIAQYINQVRVFHAKKLIKEGSLNIKAISIQVGFSSDVQFIRVFKKLEGITPGAYRTDGETE